ncbi:MAG TPA: hypothetical protein VFP80_08985 [Thermoanaerobaculia bacterium]|nr:hypothetical protein [Thermoanaerobaculia bacterium]
MRIMSVISRHRVAAIALTLALTLGAMVTTPAAASAPWICENGCWSWDINNGCTQEVTCCANGGTGDWFCILW